MDLLVARGKFLGDQRKCHEALDDLKKAEYLQPDRSEIHTLLATAYLCLQDYEKAEIAYSKAIGMGDATGYMGRAVIRHSLKKYDEVINDCNEAIRKLQTIPNFFLLLRGHSYQMLGQFLKALTDYTQIIEYGSAPNEEKSFACVNRGEVNFALGEYGNAQSDFKTTLDFRPADESALAGLAITQHKLGEVSEAQKLWRMLIGANANFSRLEWVEDHLFWHDILIDEARQIIEGLSS